MKKRSFGLIIIFVLLISIYIYLNNENKYLQNDDIIGVYVNNELNSLWEEYRRLSNPQTYKVDLSRALWYLKTKMIDSKKFI